MVTILEAVFSSHAFEAVRVKVGVSPTCTTELKAFRWTSTVILAPGGTIASEGVTRLLIPVTVVLEK